MRDRTALEHAERPAARSPVIARVLHLARSEQRRVEAPRADRAAPGMMLHQKKSQRLAIAAEVPRRPEPAVGRLKPGNTPP